MGSPRVEPASFHEHSRFVAAVLAGLARDTPHRCRGRLVGRPARRARSGGGSVSNVSSTALSAAAWVAVPFALLLTPEWRTFVVVLPALSGGAILLERHARTRRRCVGWNRRRNDHVVLWRQSSPCRDAGYIRVRIDRRAARLHAATLGSRLPRRERQPDRQWPGDRPELTGSSATAQSWRSICTIEPPWPTPKLRQVRVV